MIPLKRSPLAIKYDSPADAIGEICSVYDQGQFGTVRFYKPLANGLTFASINSETRGRRQILLANDGRLQEGMRVCVQLLILTKVGALVLMMSALEAETVASATDPP